MSKKLEFRSVVIKEKDCSLLNEEFWRLYHIFKLTICPGMGEKMFEAYYRSKDLDYIDITFFYANKNEVAGFCAAAFYKTEIDGKSVTIARSATGIVAEHRGKSLSKWALYKKYMLYKWNHPFHKLILTIYACNPFIYSMVCKYTGIVYPRVGQHVPKAITTLKKEILTSNNLQKRESEPFVVKINFEVEKSEQLKAQVADSKNKHVRFFVSKTGLKHRQALLLIIPVSFINILICICLLLKYLIISKLGIIKINLMKPIKKIEKKYNLLARFLTTKKLYANRKGM